MRSLLHARVAAPLIALAAGAASVAGFAPVGAAFLPFLTLAGLLLLWRRAASPRAAALSGFAFGAGLFGAGVSWVYVSLHDFGMMPAPLAVLGTFLFCAILALYPAAAGWCLARLRAAGPSGTLLAFPALWTVFEWIRGWLFTGVPWLAVGYSQIGSPLAGFAPLTGVYGVSFATVLAAGLLAKSFPEGVRRASPAASGSRSSSAPDNCSSRSTGQRRRASRCPWRSCRETFRRT